MLQKDPMDCCLENVKAQKDKKNIQELVFPGEINKHFTEEMTFDLGHKE